MKFYSRRLLKSEKGIALLLAIFTVVIITYLVVEITYETNVEYIVNANAVHRLKAYYAAKSGLELSLVRIKLYNKVQRQFGAKLGNQAKLLDLVWSFPFSWPLAIPTEATQVDKDMVKDTIKESFMDASYSTNISDEGSKIDLNDLDSPSKMLREVTKKQLLNVIQSKNENDPEWARKNQNLKFDEVVDNIQDWIDKDTIGAVRGSEAELYSDVNTGETQLPPNRAFRTVEELRLVAGVNEEVFNLLKDRVTVYGMKAINPNHANKDVLMSLDSSITDTIAQDIITRRQDEQLGGPFKDGADSCKSDFWGFVNSKGGRVAQETQDNLPLKCSKVSNFKIRSIGEFAGVTREITAIVFDTQAAATSIAEYVKKEQPKDPNAPLAPPNQPPPPGPATDPLPKGPPRIVYYNER